MASDFDARAATWDDDDKRARAAAVAEAIAAAVPLSTSMRLLEYGAGTGLVTQALRTKVGPVVLADASAGMRAVMETKLAAGQLGEATIWPLDLTTDPVPAERFDVIVTVLTLHHIADIPGVLRAFAGMLHPGGWLCIADLEAEDGSFHGEGFSGHHGFHRDELRADLEGAGLSGVEFRPCAEIRREDKPFPLFLATSRKDA